MATLEDFENRAKQAEELIKVLTTRISDLESAIKKGVSPKPSESLSVSSEEFRSLREENEQLRKERDALKVETDKLKYRVKHLVQNLNDAEAQKK